MISVSGPIEITSINNGIRFMAGYYTDDDRLQHVVAASNDGYVYHVTWDPSELAPGYHPHANRIDEHFGNRMAPNGMATIAGFFTPDDHYYHAVVGTNDRNLHELYYKLGGTPIRPHIRHLTDPDHYHINSFDPSKGMASFYSPGDDLRHVVIVDGNGYPVDITWNANTSPNGVTITTPLSVNQIASISGFLSTDDLYRHIIVAQQDLGQIYDIDYPDEPGVPSTVDQNSVKTIFGFPVQNVTAFCSSDSHYRRHIVVLTTESGQNWLKLRAYDRTGGFLIKNPLTPLHGNVADITSFYNAHDRLCHVLYATDDGSLSEITYTSQ